MIHKVEPGDYVYHKRRVSRIPRSNSLHVRSELGCSIQRLALLYLADHFSHVHVDLPFIFCEAVESHYG